MRGRCFTRVFELGFVMKLPVVYVCVKQSFSSHLRIDLRQPDHYTSRFAEAHKINNLIIDGNNILEIHKKLEKQISIIRKDPQPLFVEAITYRWKGHVGHRDDIDVGVKRSEDLKFWKSKDPIKRFTDGLINNSLLSNSEIEEINKEISNKIENDWDKALKSEYPQENLLTKNGLFLEKLKYSDGILSAFHYLLQNHNEFFVIGQGLWSPWYAGSTMKDLDKKFGKDRVIDSPVSEIGVTGAAIGASISGYRPLVVHPRV